MRAVGSVPVWGRKGEIMAHKENFTPPPNFAPGNSGTMRLLFLARRVLDLNVCTVVRGLLPWLKSRRGTLLEVGCGAQPYRCYVPEGCAYKALDWERARDVFAYDNDDTTYYDGTNFPFPDVSFDSVMHTEVLEHIIDPGFFLSECARILKPGGELFFTVPFQARYHYIPYDYWRYTPAGLAVLLERAGFSEWSIANRGNDVTVAAYKCISIGYRLLYGGCVSKVLGVLYSPILMFSVLIAHISLVVKGIGSNDDCLGYSVAARK